MKSFLSVWLAGHADAIVCACDHVESRDQDYSGLMHSDIGVDNSLLQHLEG